MSHLSLGLLRLFVGSLMVLVLHLLAHCSSVDSVTELRS